MASSDETNKAVPQEITLSNNSNENASHSQNEVEPKTELSQIQPITSYAPEVEDQTQTILAQEPVASEN